MLRVGTTRLMFAVFILLGLMFGTSLGYLALAALRAAKSTTKDETVPVVATNAPNPSLGNGWEYAFYATRGSNSGTRWNPLQGHQEIAKLPELPPRQYAGKATRANERLGGTATSAYGARL